jgi:hypothetical protein
MRAGPLSDRRVIDVLNRYFVCVYLNNEEYYRKEGRASVEERAELQRILQEGYARKLDVGMVRGYVLTPDGHLHDVLTSMAVLEQAVKHFKPTPGNPIVAPAPQSAPPVVPANAITLHLISRGDDRGSWGQFPAENWIVLERPDWKKLLPPGDVTPGQMWELDRDVSAKILTYFYPQTENNDAAIDRIQQHALTAKVLTVKDGSVTARVDGFLRMQHVFYPGRNDAQPLAAEVVGVLTFAPDIRPSLQLVTTIHGGGPDSFAHGEIAFAAPAESVCDSRPCPALRLAGGVSLSTR